MNDIISSCGSWAFLHVVWMAPSGHLAPGDCGSTIHLPLAPLYVHVPASSGTGLGRVLDLLTPCCMPFSAAAMVSVSSKSTTVSSLHVWAVAALTVHAILHLPITSASVAGWRGWEFFTKFSYLQKNSLSCSLILPWRCICFLVWIVLSCFHFFYCLVFTTCFTFRKAFAEPGFQVSQGEKLLQMLSLTLLSIPHAEL